MFPNKREAYDYISSTRYFLFQDSELTHEDRVSALNTHPISLAMNKLELGHRIAQITQELASYHLRHYTVAEIIGDYAE